VLAFVSPRGEIGALVAAVSLGGVIFAVHGSGQSPSTVRGPVGSDRAAAPALAPSAFEVAQRSAPAQPDRLAIEQHQRAVRQRRAAHRHRVVRHPVVHHRAAPRRAAPAPAPVVVRAAPVVAVRPRPVVVAPRPRPVIRPVVRPAPRPVVRRPAPRPAPKPKPKPAPGVSFVDTG
jgi:hypothetical protein